MWGSINGNSTTRIWIEAGTFYAILTVWNSYQKVWRPNILCGRHDWIDTEYILYKDGIVALIVGQYKKSTTQFLYFRCCFFPSDYGNGFGYKQTYTSLYSMWKTDYFWPVLNQHFLY